MNVLNINLNMAKAGFEYILSFSGIVYVAVVRPCAVGTAALMKPHLYILTDLTSFLRKSLPSCTEDMDKKHIYKVGQGNMVSTKKMAESEWQEDYNTDPSDITWPLTNNPSS